MKYSVFAIAMVAIVSALFSITPTGATSSGATSTGSTLSGTTSTGSTASGTTSSGATSTGVVVVTQKGGGGPLIAINRTTNQLEMVPQCFPWVWLTDYRNGNIFMLYRNQDACRAKRFVDFGI